MVARIVDLRKGKPPERSQPRLPLQGGKEKRVSPLRVRRRRFRSAMFFVGVLAVAALAYAVHAVSYLPAISIQAVEVSGAEKSDPESIRAFVASKLDDGAFHYISPRNIFLYPKAGLEAGIVDSMPRIVHASISRETPLSTKLHVAIGERHAYAMWCAAASASSSRCFALDDGGFVFEEVATTTHGQFETTYTFAGGLDEEPIGDTFLPGQFPSLLSLLRILQQETDLVPSRVEVLPEQDFAVAFESGFFIKASFGQDGNTLARNLDLVLSSEAIRTRQADIEYIDLRFGNRVYYKLKGEEQTNI